MKNQLTGFKYVLLCFFIFVIPIYSIYFSPSFRKKNATIQPSEELPSITLDASKYQNWLVVYREFIKAGLHKHTKANIILYNPNTNEYLKHTHRYNEFLPKRDRHTIKNIILNCKKDGLWVHTALDAEYIPYVGEYPVVFHLYPSEQKEFFIKWDAFPSFVNHITDKNNKYTYDITLNMDYNCSLIDIFSHYKLLFDRFPLDWQLSINLYPGPYIPYQCNFTSQLVKSSNEADSYLRKLISILNSSNNNESDYKEYIETCSALIKLHQTGQESVRVSFSKYAKLLLNAHYNTTNISIINANSELLPPIYE